MIEKYLNPNLVKIRLYDHNLPGFSIGSLDNWDNIKKSEIYLLDINVVLEEITIPKSFEFRKGNYIYKDSVWYYQRKIGPIEVNYSYSEISKVFTYYPGFIGKIPFIYNSFYPLGYEVSNIIIYELYKFGYIAIRSCAFRFNKKNFLLISPSFNGKSMLLDFLVNKENAEYIAEDLVFISKDCLVGVPWDSHNYGRNSGINTKSKKALDKVEDKIDYLIWFNVSDQELVQKTDLSIKNIYSYPLLESISYFGKSLSSAMMYFHNDYDVNNVIDIFTGFLSDTKILNLRTNGYNTESIMSLLRELSNE